ncbi:hypothetical protein KW790_00415 [Candidatus Parcubacteria bacterium]|nr:hypothetical protein [Candidatus Parcubacteria bacterium]
MNIFRKSFPLLVAVTFVFLGIFGAMQQSSRSSANDPQVALAEDAANYIDNGAPLQSFSQDSKTEVSQSLSPFIIIYDIKGNQIMSTALLNGKDFNVPKGVLESVKNRESRVTWQPSPDVRIAAVIVETEKSPNGATYVLAGRSLREVEARIHHIGLELLSGWVVTIFLTLTSVWLAWRRSSEPFTS